jgi:5-methylcytosine-specific restriction endonuclease McrA
MSLLQNRVLVLNKLWRPISVTTVRHAVSMVYQDSAKIVDPETYSTFDFDSWLDAAEFAQGAFDCLQGYRWKMAIPEVIVLRRYSGMTRRRIRFSRRNVFDRDQNRCQYCGKRFGTPELSLDHVLPRSRGGLSTWENLVVACYRCNAKKANRLPHEVGMKLIRQPVRPRWRDLHVRLHGALPQSWEAFLSSLYWDQELDA